jgi:glycosyltransferase involved in cell wall biosynthesis
MEGFGLVALEAASCGTPVFASGIEGLLDAVTDTRTGYLLPAQDARQYVQILTRELKNPSLARSKVRQYVLENFSWEKSAQGYLKIFEKATRP